MTFRTLRPGASLATASFLALLLLPFPACRPAPAGGAAPGPAPADLQAIRHLRDAFVRAHNEGDAERLADLFTEDAVFVPESDASCEGKREIAAYFEDVLGQGPATLEFEVLETELRGDWAFERIDATLDATDPDTGEPVEEWDRYFWILERQPGGSWKIARLIYNVDESDEEGEDTGFQTQT